MPAPVFFKYYKYIDPIENQERLIDNDVASYPHLKASTRTEIHGKIFSRAYVDELDTKEVLTTDQLFIKLNRGF